MSDSSEPIVARRPPRLLARDLALGSAAGLLIGLLITCFHMMLTGWDLHEVPLGSYFVNSSALGVVAGYFRTRRAPPMPDNPSEEDQERQQRRRRRFVATGFAIALVLSFVATSIDLAWRGWFILPNELVFNSLLFPYIGVLIGFNLSRVTGEPKWSWRCMRFNMRTVMLLIAYLALLFGLGVETGRIGRSAQRYHQQCVTAKEMVKVFGGFLRKEEARAPVRLRNAERLRHGAIPADITQGKKDFLKSLDANQKVTPEYRKYRYDLIAEGEELQGRLAAKNAQAYTTLVDYYSKLAAKYEKATQEPWLPVEADPPRP